MRYPILMSTVVLLSVTGEGTLRQPLAAETAITWKMPSTARATSAIVVATDTALLARGKAIVGTIYSACHTEQPPPKTAPPLSHVARRYRIMAGDSAAALARLTAWIAAPAKDRSLMPAMAIDRFGLMAPLPLPEEQRLAAAAYVLSLADSAQGMQGMQGMQHMPGMRGMRHGARSPGDTTR